MATEGLQVGSIAYCLMAKPRRHYLPQLAHKHGLKGEHCFCVTRGSASLGCRLVESTYIYTLICLCIHIDQV